MDQPTAARPIRPKTRNIILNVLQRSEQTSSIFNKFTNNLHPKSNSNSRIKPQIIRELNLHQIFLRFCKTFKRFRCFDVLALLPAWWKNCAKYYRSSLKDNVVYHRRQKRNGYDRFPTSWYQSP